MHEPPNCDEFVLTVRNLYRHELLPVFVPLAIRRDKQWNGVRGPVVDEAALIRALRARVINAAGLDVTEVEPTPPDNPLLDLDNVVITPHLASMAIESTIDSVKFGVQNAARGEHPEAMVPPV